MYKRSIPDIFQIGEYVLAILFFHLQHKIKMTLNFEILYLILFEKELQVLVGVMLHYLLTRVVREQFLIQMFEKRQAKVRLIIDSEHNANAQINHNI
jgi:hypothetical protein